MEHSITCILCLNDVENDEVYISHNDDECSANYHKTCMKRYIETFQEGEELICPNCFDEVEKFERE